jgi:hypothetical protein
VGHHCDIIVCPLIGGRCIETLSQPSIPHLLPLLLLLLLLLLFALSCSILPLGCMK